MVIRVLCTFLTCRCPLAPPVCRELERRQKTLEARAETERILADQAERVRQRKAAMDAQDAERAKRLQQEAHERHLANLEKRKKAELRITSEWGCGGQGGWKEGGVEGERVGKVGRRRGGGGLGWLGAVVRSGGREGSCW